MASGVILAGEPMGLFIAESEGPLDQADSYSFAVAGAEFNVAVGLSRLEHRAAYLTRLGEDPFGKRIVRALAQNGIGSAFVSFSPDRFTGFMLKSRVQTGDPEIFYFRRNSAASTLSKEDIDRADFSEYAALHLTGILPALSDTARETAFYLIDRARENGLTVFFDPNLRLQLWPDQKTMVHVINALAARADVIFPGEAEAELLTGTRDRDAVADFYLSRGTKAVVLKTGSLGAYAAQQNERVFVPGFPVEKVVDTVGAGDGFAAGTISALLEGRPLNEAVRRGNAIGAMQVMSRGDNDGLPSRAALAAFMGEDTL